MIANAKFKVTRYYAVTLYKSITRRRKKPQNFRVYKVLFAVNVEGYL